jgi:hypothetical protein
MYLKAKNTQQNTKLKSQNDITFVINILNKPSKEAISEFDEYILKKCYNT